MTPLAQHIVKQMFVPEARREFNDVAGVLPKMADAHFFECSAVMGLARNLAADALRCQRSIDAAMFLPAPRTWIEFVEPHPDTGAPVRLALLLEEGVSEQGDAFDVTILARGASAEWGQIRGMSDIRSVRPVYSADMAAAGANGPGVLAHTVYGLLAIINTPRVIGRKQHMPHRGLERRLLKARPTAGMFPLRGWTELKLEAFAQQRDESGKVHEAHLTGERCRHFCRAHLRIRLGKLEVVSAHWRGDAALGIKQTRYLVTAPRSTIAERIAARRDIPADQSASWRRRADCGEG